jgi:hypothetical protein
MSSTKEIKIILPFPLPTWNRILAMHPWQRKALRDWIHRAVSICIQDGTGSPIRTVSVERLQSMGLSIQDYYAMIRPNTSNRSRSPRKKSEQMNPNVRR